MIVSSIAPPMSWLRLVRTVTRALTFNCTPFFATASSVSRPLFFPGQSITFGYTLVCTASRTSRPARSMAVASFQSSSLIFALLAAISACTTNGTRPPAR